MESSPTARKVQETKDTAWNMQNKGNMGTKIYKLVHLTSNLSKFKFVKEMVCAFIKHHSK